MSSAVQREMSVPLGKYWRSSPLVFSFDPRCHGLAGSQKYTGMSVAVVKDLWVDISEPWSQVNDPRRCAGRVAIVATRPSRTASAVWAPGRCTSITSVSYTHLRAHETDSYLVCRLLLEK